MKIKPKKNNLASIVTGATLPIIMFTFLGCTESYQSQRHPYPKPVNQQEFIYGKKPTREFARQHYGDHLKNVDPSKTYSNPTGEYWYDARSGEHYPANTFSGPKTSSVRRQRPRQQRPNRRR